jgi:Cys-tRNA(Pro) deacylase
MTVLPPEPTVDEAGEARLRDFLARRRIAAKILFPGVPMPTVPLAAAAIGVCEDQIVKSVVFESKNGDVVLAIASGSARIDRVRLAAVSGTGKLTLAKPDRVHAVTGYPAGGVAPVGHRTSIPVVVDSRVLAQDLVFGGGGSERTLLEISPQRILDLTGATIAAITV